MNETKTPPNKITHVLMLPWSAFGHLIPFLELSIAIAKKGIHVSFLTTPGIIRRLPKIPEDLEKTLKFIPKQLPKLNQLPESAEATIDVPEDKINCLELAVDGLREQVREFVSESRPNWIVVDFFHHWVVDIAREFDNIPVIRFQVLSATTTAVLESREKSSSDRNDDDDHHQSARVSYEKKHEEEKLHKFVIGYSASSSAGNYSVRERVTKINMACKAVAIRTCLEFEYEQVKENEKFIGKPVLPVGFLLPEKISSLKETAKEVPFYGILQYLDKNSPRSVTFVGFGSECKLTKPQIHEIANGLQLSGLPFIWVLRRPEWAQTDEEIFPLGFLERIKNTGLVHIGWAPQRQILAHGSIGCCLFHAGWGSIIESLQYGHCLVLLPFVIDQPLNARLIAEKGLGIEIERDEEDGSFSGKSIAEAMNKALVSKEGEEMRMRVREVSRDSNGIFVDEKLHDSYVERFVEYLRSNGSG